MTKAPELEKWSDKLEPEDQLRHKLLTDRTATKAKIRRLMSLNGTDSNREERALLIASGQTPAPASSTKTLLDAERDHLGDLELAIKLHGEKYQALRTREGARLCQELKPAYDASAVRFAEHLIGVVNFLVETDQLQSSLRGQGIGFYPHVCNLDTDRVFGSIRDPGSPIAILLRECVKYGYLKTMPKLKV